MYTTLAVLFGLAHMVRDGTPNLGNTQLARATAALICGLGALLVFPWAWALVFWLAVWAGFYTDQQHGKGQQARGWQDAGWLAVSGATSIAPLSVATMFYLSEPRVVAVLVAAALIKPAIWFGMYAINGGYWPNRWGFMHPPTRPAAALFGVFTGAYLALVSLM